MSEDRQDPNEVEGRDARLAPASDQLGRGASVASSPVDAAAAQPRPFRGFLRSAPTGRQGWPPSRNTAPRTPMQQSTARSTRGRRLGNQSLSVG